MQPKLTYEKYKGFEDIITIDLHNNYTIIAIKNYNREKHNYSIELRIKENSIEKWDLIDDAENLVFNTNYKYINVAILKQVSKFLAEGFFEEYIKRYDYEMSCFDIGNEVIEKERLKNKDAL